MVRSGSTTRPGKLSVPQLGGIAGGAFANGGGEDQAVGAAIEGEHAAGLGLHDGGGAAGDQVQDDIQLEGGVDGRRGLGQSG